VLEAYAQHAEARAEDAYFLAFAFLVLTSAIAFIAAWLLPRSNRIEVRQPSHDNSLGRTSTAR